MKMQILRATAVLFLALTSRSLPASAGSQSAEPIPLEVHARVVDSQGQPIAGAGFLYGPREAVSTAQALTAPSARTDANGILSVSLPPAPDGAAAGRFAILTAPGKVALLPPMLGTVTGSGKSRRRVVDLGTVVLRPGVKIRGLVRSPNGKPIAGARVIATDIFRSRHLQMQIAEHVASVATTDDKGKFTLLGLPPRGVSVSISADGFQVHEVQYANRFTPVVAMLAPAGHAAGQVVDAKGKPMPGASVLGFFESSEQTSRLRTDDEGHFDLPLIYPGRYQVGVVVPGGPSAKSPRSAVMRVPRQNLRIVVPDAARPDPNTGVEIRAQSAAGEVIQDFKAVVFWTLDRFWKYNCDYLEILFAQNPTTADANGIALLRGPAPGQPSTGRVLVKAAGFAPKVIENVEWSEKERVKFDVVLEREAVVEGVVTDAKTGKPLANARVFASNTSAAATNAFRGFQFSQTPTGAGTYAETDADGHFRIGMLGEGDHSLRVTCPGRPDSAAKHVKLVAGQMRKDVELTSPRGATLIGELTDKRTDKLTGKKIGKGWRVRCNRNAEQTQILLPTSQLVLDGGPGSRGVTVGPDGKFRIRGLASGKYQLTLMIPYPLGVLELPVGPVHIRGNDLAREFDVTEELPARLHGQAKVTGVPMTPGRLLVLVQPTAANQNLNGLNAGAFVVNGFALNRFNLLGPTRNGIRALVCRDGSFDLPLRRGNHVVKLIDLATGVTLYQSPNQLAIKSGADQVLQIATELAAVVVQLVSDKEGGRILANRLELRVHHPNAMPNPLRALVAQNGMINIDSGVGIALHLRQEPTTTTVTLILPALETELIARSSAHQFDPQKSQYNFPPLAEETIQPTPSKMNRVKLVITEPQPPNQPPTPQSTKAPLAHAGSAERAPGPPSRPPQPRYRATRA